MLAPPPPQILPEEKPKLAFEVPRPAEVKPPGTGRFTTPPPTVAEMGRELAEADGLKVETIIIDDDVAVDGLPVRHTGAQR